MKRLIYIIVGFTLLFISCNSHYDERHKQLLELQAINRADSLMTNDSLAQALVVYFDRHGTGNDRLLAHYLLGRTYADLGQTPQALEAYHNAVDQADTTAPNCDFAILSRVYAQMSDIFYQQNLMQDYLSCLDRSIDNAWKAKDTATAMKESAFKTIGYQNLQQFEKATTSFDSLYEQLCHYYGIEIASRYCVLPIKSLLACRQFSKSKHYLDVYETYSGYFDSCHNICEGRENFYYYIGMYYLSVCQYDSSEFYFRKELYFGKDFKNQNMASRGLSLLFQQTHRPDSAAKYALYSYEMNDSVYAQMATQEVEQAQAIYNYSHHQQRALQEKERAERAGAKLRLITFFFVVFALLSIWLLLFWRKKRRAAIRLYQEKKEELSKARSDLAILQSNRVTIDQVISEKEEIILRLQSEVDNLKLDCRQLVVSERQRLKENATYKRIQKKANSGQKLNSEEWEEIEQFMQEQQPEFCKFLSKTHIPFDNMGLHVCILLRLHFSIKSTGSLLGVSGPRVSQISEVILNDLFGMNGSGKDLSMQLSKIC